MATKDNTLNLNDITLLMDSRNRQMKTENEIELIKQKFNIDVTEMKNDINDIKENHLAHIERDVNLMKTDIALINNNLSLNQKIVFGAITAVLLSFIGAVIALVIR